MGVARGGPGTPAPAPVVLAILPQLIPSTMIGVVKPLLALHRQGRIAFDVTLESWVGRGRLAAADVVVFCRNTEPRYSAVLEAVRALGTPIVYELDDDFFAIPEGTPGGEYHREAPRLAQLERYLRSAALVRVYSEALRARVASLNPRVHRVDALVDWDLVPAAAPLRPPGPLRIAYATSRTADSLAGIFMPDLRRLLDTYRGRVEAWFWGYRPAELVGRPGVHFVDFVQDYDAFVRRFSRAGLDIGLAPLPDDEFHLAKSDNKFREYAASRIAGIYSDVVVYRDCVEHTQTGLLVPEVPQGWFMAMARLIEDEALRRRIADRALAYARGRYGVAPAAETWLRHIEAARAAGREASPAAPAGAAGSDLATARRLGVAPRLGRVVRRTVEVLRGRPTPSVAAIGARIRWHLESLRALRRLQREVARAAVRSADRAPRDRTD